MSLTTCVCGKEYERHEILCADPVQSDTPAECRHPRVSPVDPWPDGPAWACDRCGASFSPEARAASQERPEPRGYVDGIYHLTGPEYNAALRRAYLDGVVSQAQPQLLGGFCPHCHKWVNADDPSQERPPIDVERLADWIEEYETEGWKHDPDFRDGTDRQVAENIARAIMARLSGSVGE